MWSSAAPHFLFNTLTAIQAYVRERPSLAEEMIGVLAQFCRATLGRGEGVVPLAKELALVQLYLGLERARLGFRLRTLLDVDPRALALPVPSLIVQPLVENAVVHAAARRAEGATLRLAVRYRHEQRRLLILVADDGPGFTRSGMSEPGGPGPPEGVREGSLGLSALRQRLHALYASEARLRLLRRPGGGTIAAVVLPAALPPGRISVVPPNGARPHRRR